MVAVRICRSLSRAVCKTTPSIRPQTVCGCRNASDQASDPFSELESGTSLANTEVPEDVIKSFDPIKSSRARKQKLPSSRYIYMSFLFSISYSNMDQKW